MRNLEFQFQKELVKNLSNAGWACYHPGSIPGLPDLLCFKAPNFGKMIELKVLEECDKNKSIKSKFEPQQKPFYLEQIKNTRVPVFIIFKIFTEFVSYKIVTLETEKEVLEFFEKKCSHYMDGDAANMESLKALFR